ncbi:PKD domain-containing protein [Arthrobacter sp. TmT3-37]
MGARRSFVAGVACAFLVAGFFASSGATGRVVAPAALQAVLDTPGTVHFTTSGDISASSQAATVLTQVRSIDPDLHLALGDLSYGATGAEQAWCDFVTSRVGAGFPFELLSGNHESDALNGNINDFSACLPNQLPGLVGTYGRQYYVDVPEVNPVVRYVMISPALTYPDGLWSYSAGSARYQWTAAAIDGARAAGVPWVVVGMHKPCLSVGQYSCEPGSALMNLLVSKKVDLVLSGHEHLYARSKQLAHGPSCSSVTPGTYTAGCVRDADNSLVKGAGTVFAIVGTGGTPLRDVDQGDTEGQYFAASSGLNAQPAFGNLEVSATATSLAADFRPADTAAFTDSFTITAGTSTDEPPTAFFTSSCTDLTCSVDGSASSDPDGSIAGYAWTFGDGATATGAVASHSYATAGTYTIGLTVTDNAGQTAATTRSLTVTTPGQPVGLATDTFSRTVTNGFGTAEVGGSWTTTGTSSRYSVSDTGRVVFSTPGVTNNAYLAGVSSTATDLRMTVSADKRATGNGIYVSPIARRVLGAGSYQAKIVLRSTGAVGLSLARANATGGSEVVLQPAIDVPGLTLAAGDILAVRVQASGTNPTTLRAKVWKSGSAEPAAWQRSVTDTTAGLQAAGGIGINMYLSSTATNAPVTLALDDLNALTPTP